MQEVVQLLEPGQTALNLEQMTRSLDAVLKTGLYAEAGLMSAGSADAVRKRMTYNEEQYQEFVEEMKQRFKQRQNYSVVANMYDAFRHPYRRGRETATKAMESYS